MKSILLTLIIIIINQYVVYAGIDKLDSDLRMLSLSLQSKEIDFPLSKAITYNPNVVDVFIKTTSNSTLIDVIERNNGKVLGTYGSTIVSARIPYKVVDILHQMPEVVKMESAKIVSVSDTKAKQHIGADKVHNGSNPLPRAFTGKGVLVGIIDTGIDFFHKEFFRKDDSTKSRIIGIYDTKLNSIVPPFGLPYGKYFSQEEIQSTLNGTSSVALETIDVNGHGTHVAGIAAGLSGFAPDAELVIVKALNRYNYGNLYTSLTSEILISMQFLEEIAKIEKKPIVFNLSLGISQGIRDGSDLASQALDELLLRNPNSVCVVAAGNDGEQFLHWGGNLKKDVPSNVYISTHGLIEDNEAESFYSMRIPIADTGTFELNISPISIVNEMDIYQISEINFSTNFQINENNYNSTPSLKIGDLLKNGYVKRNFKLPNQKYIDCSYEIFSTIHDDAVELSIYLKDQIVEVNWLNYKSLDLFLVSTKGSENIHLWNNNNTGTFINFPTVFGLQHYDDLVQPDRIMNLSTFPTLSKNCITVGAYTNAQSVENLNNINVSFGGYYSGEGQIAPFSSKGPASDGRVKPDITAPGHNVVSARSRNSHNYRAYYLPDTTYIVLSGTSMSSPVVCGAVALLLEQNPNLTVEEIRALLIKTADKDEFTGTVPNPTWGWGKLNIFAAMQRLIVSVAEKNISSTLKVFPSVASSSFSVSTEQAEETNEVFLVNSLGETLEWKKANKLQLQQCEFNVKGLPSGQYYVVVKNQKGVQSQAVQVVK
jgi:minor extracellular serine protease Vpr